MMRRIYPIGLVVTLLAGGCAAGLQTRIADSFDAAQSVSVGGENIIKEVCLDMAQRCIADGKKEPECKPFQVCKQAYFHFNNASKAAITALSLAEAARVAGDEKRASELLEAASRALLVARDILESFIGLDEEVQP